MCDTIINIYTGNSNNDSLTQKIDLLMASFQELSAKVGQLQLQVTNLQTAIDTEQQQVTDALNTLNTTIQQLQEQVQNGGTLEQRQELLNQLISIQDTLTSAQTDLSTTIADTPPPPPEGSTGGTGSDL